MKFEEMNRTKEKTDRYQLRERREMDEIVHGVGLDDELRRGAEGDGGAEVGEAKRYRFAVIDVAWVSE